MKIKSALISVFDKNGIDSLAQSLANNGVTIYSTGGTKTYLENLGHPVEAVEGHTKYPEVFGGRVKTLHPAIFGGILYRRDNASDLQELEQHHIPSIDLVVVDLYPFEDTVASGAAHQDIIEKIDIGGISLIRATAKNYKDTAIVSSKTQYAEFEAHYNQNQGSTTEAYRRELATQAFVNTKHYDTAISNYFMGVETKHLRYGENPHQAARFEGNLNDLFEQLGGKELSYNNLLDVDAAVNLLLDIRNEEGTSFAVPVSAFGGIFITDKEIDLATAEQINEIFYEICIAPSYSEDALALLTSKGKRILLKWNMKPLSGDIHRTILNGTLIQGRDDVYAKEADLVCKTTKNPSPSEISDLLFAEKLVKNTKSNAIILVKDGQLLASGTGQTSRVDALRQAIAKAKAFKFELEGAVMASDAFFPFPDCVEIASEEGISAVIQPGGSIKDQLSIDACNERGMSMVFTGNRHFKH
jgi:phosphoribosylaminoimidazolecarboxamide formyltransferase/IMP cyclohydrolase